jgi:hypothetical protein
MSWEVQPSGDDILLNFNLLAPEKQSWFVGDITFATQPVVSQPRITSPAVMDDDQPEEEFVPFPELQSEIDKLPKNVRNDFYRQLQNLIPKRKSYRIKPIVTDQPAEVRPTVYNAPPSVSGVENSTTKLNRQKRVDFIKKFLAEYSLLKSRRKALSSP